MNLTKRLLNTIFVCLSVLVMMSTVSGAQEYKREGKSEYFFLLQGMGGDTAKGSISGTTVEMDVGATTVAGIGMGTNINDNLNFNFDIFFGNTDLNSRVRNSYTTATVATSASLIGYDFNLDYNILKDRFTPIVTGGIGFINFNGDTGGISMSETDFSYNLGGGFRYDASDHFVIKGIYKTTWTTMKDTDNSIKLGGIGLSLEYMF